MQQTTTKWSQLLQLHGSRGVERNRFDCDSDTPSEPLTGFNEAYELITCTSRRNRCLPGWPVALPPSLGRNCQLTRRSLPGVQLAGAARTLYENCMTNLADCGNWPSRQRAAICLRDIVSSATLISLRFSAAHYWSHCCFLTVTSYHITCTHHAGVGYYVSCIINLLSNGTPSKSQRQRLLFQL